MKTLSLCMIVKNEEETLERCLKSVGNLFDEIIIVDTGSTDKTKEIAKNFATKILDFKWIDDFSKARNFAIENCTSDYFMWLDADDVITKKNLKKLFDLKLSLENLAPDFVFLNYDVGFDEKNRPNFSFLRERIIKNNGKYFFENPVHEVITPQGKILYFEDISIQHRKIKPTKSDRNLKIYEKQNKNNFSTREIFYYSRELMQNGKFKKAIKFFKLFLSKKDGFLENKIEACENLAFCYEKLEEFEKSRKILFYSFNFDLPRANILCKIGYYYKNKNDFEKAIYYFNLASKCKMDKKNLSFVKKDYFDFIPYLEQCVCYYNLGDEQKSLKFNNLAKKVKKNNQIVLQNEKILKNILSNKT